MVSSEKNQLPPWKENPWNFNNIPICYYYTLPQKACKTQIIPHWTIEPPLSLYNCYLLKKNVSAKSLGCVLLAHPCFFVSKPRHFAGTNLDALCGFQVRPPSHPYFHSHPGGSPNPGYKHDLYDRHTKKTQTEGMCMNRKKGVHNIYYEIAIQISKIFGISPIYIPMSFIHSNPIAVYIREISFFHSRLDFQGQGGHFGHNGTSLFESSLFGKLERWEWNSWEWMDHFLNISEVESRHPFWKSPPVVSHSGLYLHGRKILPPSKDTSKSSVPQMAANDSCTTMPGNTHRKKTKTFRNTKFNRLI